MKNQIKSISIILAVFCITSLSACGFDKALRQFDFDIKLDSTLTGAVVEISPKVDIKSITYKVTLYDSNDKIVKEETYTQTNLSKGETYKYTHNIGFTTMLTASKFRVEFIEGKK